VSGFAWLFAGAAVGALDFWLLWRTVRALQPGTPADAGAARAVGAGLVRILGVALVLLLAMQRGLAAGLWALAGFTLARFVWLWRLAE